MAINLFGETIETAPEYAKRLITAGYAQPAYKIRIKSVQYWPFKSIKFDLIDENGEIVKNTNCSGIYTIWEGFPGRDNCLYAGGSVYGLRQRIYRFLKELFGVSRPDETHPAGKKCRHYGINPHNLYVKFLRSEDFPDMKNRNLILKDDASIECFMDQYVAPLLGTRFNKKVKK